MDRSKRIALLLGHDQGHCRAALRGIRAYAMQRKSWRLHDGPPDPRIVEPLRKWKPHGIIAHLFVPELAHEVARLDVPMVNITSNVENLDIPLVEVDHEAIGRLAAEHFLDRHFHEFGFFGSNWAHSSRIREAGFSARLARAGYTISSCYVDYLPRLRMAVDWTRLDEEVQRWLQKLPKPVAILTCNDPPARDLANFCRQLGLRVPDTVALLGVDNDELECGLASPPLSSVAIPGERIGFEAARLLHRLMSGRPAPKRPRLLPPIGVVTRQSTDTLAIEDRQLAAALGYIAAHADEMVSVSQVARAAGIGRRILERRFRSILGRSVLSEIRRAHIERAKQLLAQTDFPISLVAARSGFSCPQRLAVVFRSVTGLSPTGFRARCQIRR